MKKSKKIKLITSLSSAAVIAAIPGATAFAVKNNDKTNRANATVSTTNATSISDLKWVKRKFFETNSKATIEGLVKTDNSKLFSQNPGLKNSIKFTITPATAQSSEIGILITAVEGTEWTGSVSWTSIYDGTPIPTSYSIEGGGGITVGANGYVSKTLTLKDSLGTVIPASDVVWSFDQTQGSHSRITFTANEYTVAGISEGSDTYTAIAVYKGLEITTGIYVTVTEEHDYYIVGNSTVNVKVAEKTNWIDLYLVDKKTEQVFTGDVMWSIYGTGTHSHAQRNAEVSNQYSITGETWGNDTLDARAIYEKADGTLTVQEFKIPVNVSHAYSIDGVGPISVAYNETTEDAQTLSIVDETGTEVSDPENVTFNLEAVNEYTNCTIYFDSTDNTYTVKGKVAGDEQCPISATYKGETINANITVNVKHKYTVVEGTTPPGVVVGETSGWITFKLEDENHQEVNDPTNLQWSIYKTGVSAIVERNPDQYNQYRITGRSAGTDTLSARATYKGEIVCEFTITANVGHSYNVLPMADVTTVPGYTSKEKTLVLYDDTNTIITEGVLWDVKHVNSKTGEAEETAEGTYSSAAVSSENSTFTATGNVGAEEDGDDIYEITASFDDAHKPEIGPNAFKQRITVHEKEYKITGADDISLKSVIGENTKTEQLSVVDRSGATVSDVVWSAWSDDASCTLVSIGNEVNNGLLTAKSSIAISGTDHWTIYADIGDDIKITTSITVSANWI